MSGMIRTLLFAGLCVTGIDASAEVIPRLGDNIVRDVPPDDPNEVLTTPGARTFPAVADLNLTSDDPSTRRFAVAWLNRVERNFDNFETIQVAIIDSEGDLIAGPSEIASYRIGRPSNPAIAVDGNGYFTVVWSVVELDFVGGSRDFNQKIYARTFRPEEDNRSLCPADGLPVLSEAPETVLLDTASIPQLDDTPGDFDLNAPRLNIDADSSFVGRTVIAFSDHRAEPHWGIYSVSTMLDVDDPLPDPDEWCSIEHAQLMPPGSPVRVAGDGEFQAIPRVAVNPNTDRAVIVWRSHAGAIKGQRLDADGGLNGTRFEVASTPDSIQESVHDPDVGYGSDGFFRVVWEFNGYANPANDISSFSQILMSRFDDAGNVAEEGIPIDREDGSLPATMRSLRSPRIQALDLDGDFAVSWSRQRSECPGSATADWFVSSVGSPTCSIGDLPDAEGICQLQLNPDSGGLSLPPCRGQVRIESIADGVPVGDISLTADGPANWDDMSASRVFSIEFGFNNPTRDKCALLVHSSPIGPSERLVRQRCDATECITCEEQADAVGVRLPGPARPETGKTGGSTATREAGVFVDADIRLRWLQAQFQTEELTQVAPTTISDQPLVSGAPALAMGRSGDMMAAWIAEGVPNPDPEDGGTLRHALVTQNLAGPVELSINDVGILEGPLIRATGNFTLTANKPYPVRPGECTGDTPRPTVSLLTADGSASFLSGDYTRTSGTLAFDPCSPLAPLSLGFPVPVNDDDVFEDTESFFVNLFDEKNAIVVRRQGTGAIVDNDPPATVSSPGGIIEVCEDGTTPLAAAPRCPGTGTPRTDVELAFELDIDQEVEGSVEFVTMDGSAFGDIEPATAGDDYEPVAGELQFLPGTTQVFLSIELIEDDFAELPEQFFVQLTGADNLTLPANDKDLRINVNIIDDDVCATPPAWFLPDPDAAVPETLPTHGTAAERSGYFCVVNPEGFDTCPWEARLDLNQGEEPWLARTNIVFSAPPDPDGVTADDIQTAQSACALIADTTGAIRYTAEENLPNPADPVAVQTRTQRVLFLNGAADPEVRDVTQAGGDCAPLVTPPLAGFFPVGGSATFEVSFGDEPACEFTEWSAQVDSSAEDWLSIDGASVDTGRFTFNGPGSFSIEVDPYLPDTGPVADRVGVINVGDGVQVIQEAPLFDHFDDETTPSPLGWQYLEPDSWSETGTHLTASTPGQARIIADPEFPGCSLCLLETTVRIDTFGKGQATVYMWWRDEADHLRLVADEFFDTWTLVQRVAGVDHVLREFNADILVREEYPVRMEYRDDLGGPLITVDVDGQAMCPTPGPGLEPCTPWDPDPDDVDVPPVIGSGTIGLGAAATTASFNLLRVIRADALSRPLDVLFISGFESVD